MKKLLVTMVTALSAVFAARAAADVHTTTFDTAATGDFAAKGYQEDSKYYWYSEADVSGSIAAGGATNTAKYLEVATYAPLYRAVNGSSSQFSGAPSSAAVLTEGTVYADMFVKFSVRDEPPELDAGNTKLGVWMQEAGGTTNLYFKAASLNGSTVTTNNYVITTKGGSALTAASLVDGQWHRLTVKAIGNVATSGTVPAFAAFLDGDILGYDTSVTGISNVTLNDIGTHLYNSDRHCLFPSMAQSDATLASVSITGQGAVDEVGFMTTAPVDEARDPAAKIGTVYYFTFQNAIDAATGVNDVIELLANNSEAVNVGAGKAFTLNEGGYTFSGTFGGSGTVRMTAKPKAYTATTNNGGALFASTWTGTYQIAWNPGNVRFVFNDFGNSNSKIEIVTAFGAFPSGAWVANASGDGAPSINPEIVLSADWTIANGWQDVAGTTTFSKISGSAVLYANGGTGTDAQNMYYNITALDNFTGTLAGSRATYKIGNIVYTGTPAFGTCLVKGASNMVCRDINATTVNGGSATLAVGTVDLQPGIYLARATVAGVGYATVAAAIAAAEASGATEVVVLDGSSASYSGWVYANNTYTIAVASVAGVEYTSLSEAVAQSQAGETVTLLQNSAETAISTTGKDFVFAENGKAFTGTFTGNGTITVSTAPSSTTWSSARFVANGWTGTFVIDWPTVTTYNPQGYPNKDLNFNKYGIQGSTVRLNKDFTGYLTQSSGNVTIDPAVDLNATLTISNGYAKSEANWPFTVTLRSLSATSSGVVNFAFVSGYTANYAHYVIQSVDGYDGQIKVTGDRNRVAIEHIEVSGQPAANTSILNISVTGNGSAIYNADKALATTNPIDVTANFDFGGTPVTLPEQKAVYATVSETPGIYYAVANVGSAYYATYQAAVDGNPAANEIAVLDATAGGVPSGWAFNGDNTKLLKQFSVTFTTAHGSAPAAQTVAYGSTATEPADPTETGYTFDGWLAGGVAYDFDTPVTGDVTLTAKWFTNVAKPTAATGLVYNGSEQTGVAAGTGYTLSGTAAATAAGDYTATATLDEGYIWSDGTTADVTRPWSIGQKALTITANSASRAYNGAALTDDGYTAGAVATGDSIDSVTVSGSQTIVGSSANVPSAAVIKRGDADVTGNYDITYANGTLTITPATATIPTAVTGLVYDNTLKTGVATGIGYTLENNTATAAGNYTATATLAENYVWSDDTTAAKQIAWSIAAKPVAVSVSASTDTKTYNGSEQTFTPAFTYTCEDALFDSNKVTFGGTATLSRTEVGTTQQGLLASQFGYTDTNLAVTFTVTQDGSLTISKKGLTITVAGSTSTSLEYTGSEQTVTVDSSKYTLTCADLLYDASKVTRTATTASGTNVKADYALGLAASQFGYSDTNVEAEFVVTDGTFAITPKAATITVANASKTYGDADPAFTGTVAGLVNASDLGTVTYSRSNDAENAGTYTGVLTASYTANANYDVTVTPGDFTISKKTVELEWTNTSLEYNGTAQKPTATVTAASLVGSDTLEVVVEGERTDVGSDYVATATGLTGDNAANYLLPSSATATFAITARALTITAASATKVYDGTALTTNGYSVTSGELATGDTIDSVTVTGSQANVGSSDNVASAAVIKNAGGANVTANYDITYEKGSLTVTAAGMTIEIAGYSGVYDGEAHSVSVASQSQPDATVVWSVDNGDTWSAEIPSITDVGTVTVIAKTTKANYSDATSSPVTLVVTPATATIPSAVAGLVYDGEVQTGVAEGTGYAISGNTATDAGSYTATLTLAANYKWSDNTTDATKTIPWSIAAKTVGLTWINTQLTYNGSAQKPTATATGLVSGDVVGVTVSGEQTNVGSYTATADALTGDAAANYALPAERTTSFKISSASDLTIAVTGGEFVYDGAGHSPTYDVNQEDVTVQWSLDGGSTWLDAVPAITNAGSITVTAKASKANYADATSEPATLTVTAKALTITAASATKVYDGTALTTNDYSVTSGELATGDTIDSVTVTGSQTNVGSSDNVASAAVIKNAGGENVTANYAITYEKGSLTVTAAGIVIEVAGTASSATYTGSALTGTVAYTLSSSDTLYDASKVSFSGAATVSGTTVGNYAYGLAASQFSYNDANFTATFNVTDANFTINKAAITVAVTPVNQTLTYNGALQTADVRLGTAYTLSSADSLYVAANVVRDDTFVTGTTVGDYAYGLAASQFSYADANIDATFSVTDGKLTIGKAAISVAVTGTTGTSLVYSGSEQTVTVDSTKYTLSSTDSLYDATKVNYRQVEAKGTAVNTYALGLAADQFSYDDDNITATFTVTDGSFAITPKTLTVTADAKSKTYGDADPELTYTSDGLVGGDALTGALARAAGEGVGSYAITQGTLSAGSNYTISYTGANLTVTKAAVTVKADNLSKSHGKTDPALTWTATGLKNGDAESVLTVSISREAGETVGTYPITVTGAAEQGNYAVSYENGTFTITSGLAITVADVTATYDGTEHGVVATVSPAEGSTVSYSLDNGTTWLDAAAMRDAGTTNVLVKAENADYATVTTNVTLTVDKREITITAASETKVYDGTALTTNGYSVTVGTLAEDDYIDSLAFSGSQTIVGKSANTASDAVIKNALGDDVTANYDIDYVAGELEVTAAGIVIEVAGTASSATYSGSEQTGTVAYGATSESSFFNAEKVVYSGAATVSGTTVGDYAYGLAAGKFSYNDANFTATFNVTDANFSITPKVATITVTAASKTYGDADPAFTGTITGLVSDGDLGTVTYSRSNDAEAAGTYTGVLTASYTANANYSVTVVPANFTITAKSATITVANATKVYGDADPAFTGTVDGLVNENDLGTVTYSRTGAETDKNVGTYNDVLTASYTANANYSVTVTPGDFTITKAAVTVKADNISKSHGKTDPALTWTATGLKNGDAESVLTVSISREAGEAVGTYPITVTGAAEQGNYTVSYENGTFTITSGLAITVADVTATYDGTEHGVVATVSPAEGSTVSYSLDNGTTWLDVAAMRDAGTTNVLVKAENADYATVTTNVTLTVDKREITITAASETKVYDGTALTTNGYSVTVGELATGDEFESVTVTGTQTDVGTSANVASAAVIKNAGDENVTANYAITYVDGTLEVTAAGMTLEFAGYTGTYDGNAHSEAAVPSVVAGTTVEYKVGDGEWTTTPPSITDVGTLSVQVRATNANYNEATTNGTLTVSRREVGLSWTDGLLTYTGLAQAPGVAFLEGSIVNNDDVSVTVSGAQTDAGENYTATAVLSGTKAGNYALPAASTTAFDIAQREVTITWSNTEFSYDGTSHVPTATLGNVVDGDVVGVTVTGAATSAGTHTAEASALTGDDAVNYKLPAAKTVDFEIKDSGIVIQFL